MRLSVICTFLSQAYCAAMATCSYGPNDTGPHGMAIYATKLETNILTTSHTVTEDVATDCDWPLCRLIEGVEHQNWHRTM